MSARTVEEVLRWARRTLAVVFGVPMAIGIGMSLVDSYRRRGKKPKPFPTTPPTSVEVGEGTITTYTFGQDLYADMLAAIEGAQRQVLFETYIWKGDAVGERFKAALAAAAARGVEVYCIYDGFANLVVSPRFKRFPPTMKVLRYPVYGAGWRFFDLRRYGRDHRKILVVDEEVVSSRSGRSLRRIRRRRLRFQKSANARLRSQTAGPVMRTWVSRHSVAYGAPMLKPPTKPTESSTTRILRWSRP